MIIDKNIKFSVITEYKGHEIEVVTDLNDITYFRQRHVGNAIGISRVTMCESVKSKLGSGATVYFVVKCSDTSWNPTGFLAKHHLIELMEKRSRKPSKLFLAWVNRYSG